MPRRHYHGVLVTCIDGLWIRTALKASEEILGGHKIDFCVKPGGAQQLKSDCPVTGKQLSDLAVISIGKHHVYDIVLCNHMDCLAYGGSEAFSSADAEKEMHIEHLRLGVDFLTVALYDRFESMLYHPDKYPGVNLRHIANVLASQSLRIHPIFLVPHDIRVFDGDPEECFIIHA